MAIHYGEIHALRGALAELVLQRGVRPRILGKHDDTRRITIDAMHHERLSLAMRSKVVLDLIEDRFFLPTSFKRDREQPSRLVEHDQILIFVENA